MQEDDFCHLNGFTKQGVYWFIRSVFMVKDQADISEE